MWKAIFAPRYLGAAAEVEYSFLNNKNNKQTTTNIKNKENFYKKELKEKSVSRNLS